MKRIVIGLFLLVLALQLSAQHGGGDFDLLVKYQKEASMENLTNALKFYTEMLETEKKENGQIALANLHLMAMTNVVEDMVQEVDSLTMRSQFQLANLLLETGSFEKSINIYNTINESAPTWSCPWRHKGEALMKMGKWEFAEQATIEAIKTREEHYDAYIQLARIQKELSKYTDALKSLEKGNKYKSADYEDEVSEEEVKILQEEIEKLINK